MRTRHIHPVLHLLRWPFILAQGGIVGLSAACLVGAFRWGLDAVPRHVWPAARELPARYGLFGILLWGAVLVALAYGAGRMVRAVPLISGGGIPQVELECQGRLHVPLNIWLRVIAAKFLACLMDTAGGLSQGREGPSVQLGAGIGAIVDALCGHTESGRRNLLAAGGAAGMAAAFSAPWAGFIFAFEELKRPVSRTSCLLTLSAAFTAWWGVGAIFGFGQLFPFDDISAPEPAAWWKLLLVGLALGLGGSLYNRALIRLKTAESRLPIPRQWRILPSMLLAGVFLFTLPEILGGGGTLIVQTGGGGTTFAMLLLFLAGKVFFSLLSFTGDAPGGILMPILCVGALLGLAAGCALDGVSPSPENACWLICGMAGFFAAVLGTPLLGLVLVMEISGAASCLPAVALVILTADLTASRLHITPIYAALRSSIVVNAIPGGKRRVALSPRMLQTRSTRPDTRRTARQSARP